MATIINFNKARKAKLRADAERQAAENRVKFGRTKAQKQLSTAETEAAQHKLDQIKLEPATAPDDKSVLAPAATVGGDAVSEDSPEK